jgi:hypothetical protein
MSPLMLIAVGAAVAALTSLAFNLTKGPSASSSARLILSLPLLATAALIASAPQEMLSLSGVGSESGAPLSFTLQYHTTETKLDVFEAALRVSPSDPSLWAFALCGVAFIAFLATVMERRQAQLRWMSASAGVAWLSAWAWWAISSPLSPLSQASGEAGVRSFLQLGPLDAKRALRFVPPSESWSYQPTHLMLIGFSMLGALGLIFFALRPNKTVKTEEQGLERVIYASSALLALVGVLWSGWMAGYTGGATQTAAWGAAIMLALGAAGRLPSLQRATLANLALIVLCASL